jgi:cation transport ATPase
VIIAAASYFAARASVRGVNGLMSEVMQDHIRERMNAAGAGALNKMGVRTLLLRGDSRAVADAVALQLGIGEIVAEALPEDKLARIRVFV